MAVDLSDRYNVDMVYPQSMFPLGGEEGQGDQQQQRQQHPPPQQQSDELRSDLLRQLQQQREMQYQQQHQQHGVTSPGLGPSAMNPQSMLAAGISPAMIDAHQRRTQSILDAAIAAANQAGDARAAASMTQMASGGMGGGMGGAAGMGGMGGGGGMGGMGGGGMGAAAGMGAAGMGYASGMGAFQRPSAYGGYGQSLQSPQEAALLQNRYSLGAGAAAGLPPSYGMGGMSAGGMASPMEPALAAPPRRRTPPAKKRPPAAAAKKSTKKRAKTFPEKLMSVMTDLPNDDAVAWLPDGKSFVVVDPDLFVDTILSQVFKGCKYSSFVRKLHRWGFVRLTSGTGTDCFHHPLFQRNRQDLCLMITCTPRDGKEQKQTAGMNEKPPSLAGVEKFITSRAKKMAASAARATGKTPSSEGSGDSEGEK